MISLLLGFPDRQTACVRQRGKEREGEGRREPLDFGRRLRGK